MEPMQQGPDREWVGLGQQQEVNPTRILHAESKFEEAVTYAVKSQSHLWTVVLIHVATKQMLDAFTDGDPTNMPMLDADTLASRPVLCCYLCGAPYADTRERMRKCKGDVPA